MDVAVDLFAAFGNQFPGITVDDEDTGSARGNIQKAAAAPPGDLQQTSDIGICCRGLGIRQLEEAEGIMFGIKDVQAVRRSHPFGAAVVLEHIEDGGAGQAVFVLAVMPEGLETQPVETDEAAFCTHPYITAPVLIQPVELRIRQAEFRGIKA